MGAEETFAPLRGRRVIDLTTSFAGPYCSQLLGALGAEVIKIESPRGDDARQWGPPFFGGDAAIFLAANAGKRSLALDLRRGSEVVHRLVDGADVLVQSMRPGLADELGLGSDAMRARNPRLVYCSIGAYGKEGPKRDLPGYDPLMQAAGGLISVTGEPGRPPLRAGVSLIDQGTGMWGAFAVLSALLEREQTGVGREIDVALYETAVTFMCYHLIGYLGSGTVPVPRGSAFPSVAPYQIFEVSDGRLMLAAASDRMFQALLAVLGLPELADDPRFASNPDRVVNRQALNECIEPRLLEESRDVWLERFAAARIPAAPVQDAAAVVADPQTPALGILQDIGEITLLAPPVSFDGHRPLYQSVPPQVGADSAAILASAGYTEQEIEGLAAEGIVLLGGA